jgi:hypothetical protein
MGSTTTRRLTWLATGLLVVSTAACGQPEPIATGQPLVLLTAPDFGSGCPSGGLLPVRVGRIGEEMSFVTVGTGERVSVVWPIGFTAQVVDGVARLISSRGELIASEGDVLDNLGGSFDPAGTAFVVCSIGPTLY